MALHQPSRRNLLSTFLAALAAWIWPTKCRVIVPSQPRRNLLQSAFVQPLSTDSITTYPYDGQSRLFCVTDHSAPSLPAPLGMDVFQVQVSSFSHF